MENENRRNYLLNLLNTYRNVHKMTFERDCNCDAIYTPNIKYKEITKLNLINYKIGKYLKLNGLDKLTKDIYLFDTVGNGMYEYGYKAFIIASLKQPNDEICYYCWEQDRNEECCTCGMCLNDTINNDISFYIADTLYNLLKFALTDKDVEFLIAYYAKRKLAETHIDIGNTTYLI